MSRPNAQDFDIPRNSAPLALRFDGRIYARGAFLGIQRQCSGKSEAGGVWKAGCLMNMVCKIERTTSMLNEYLLYLLHLLRRLKLQDVEKLWLN